MNLVKTDLKIPFRSNIKFPTRFLLPLQLFFDKSLICNFFGRKINFQVGKNLNSKFHNIGYSIKILLQNSGQTFIKLTR